MSCSPPLLLHAHLLPKTYLSPLYFIFNSHFFPNIPIHQPSLLPASRPLSSPSTSFYAHDCWTPPCFTLPSCISLIHPSFIALLSDTYSLCLLPHFWHFDRFLSLMNTNTAFSYYCSIWNSKANGLLSTHTCHNIKVLLLPISNELSIKAVKQATTNKTTDSLSRWASREVMC